MLEKQIQKNIIKYIRSLPGGEAENVHGDAYSAGRADINACYKGRLFRIEVKTPDNGNKATVIQEENLKKWGKAGAICVVVYSLDEVKALVNESGILCNRARKDHTVCNACPIKDCFTIL